MYEIKEVVIKQIDKERKQLVIEFDDPKMAIVGAFLMNDALLLHADAASKIHDVLSGRKSIISFSGIRCHLLIKKDETEISDLYEDVFDDGFFYSPYKIDTNQLYELIKMWKEKVKEFRQRQK